MLMPEDPVLNMSVEILKMESEGRSVRIKEMMTAKDQGVAVGRWARR